MIKTVTQLGDLNFLLPTPGPNFKLVYMHICGNMIHVKNENLILLKRSYEGDKFCWLLYFY